MQRAVVAGLVALAVAPQAARAADYTWSGAGTPLTSNWSTAANWSGGTAPADGETIGTLTFPAITDPGCSAPSPATACAHGTNDRAGLTVGTLAIDDGPASSPAAAYQLGGNGITLTAGLAAAPAGAASGTSFLSVLAFPIALGAPQTWTVAGFPPPVFVPTGLELAAPVSGVAHPLTISMSHRGFLLLSGDNEVGPLTVVGVDPGVSGGENGQLSLQPLSTGVASLNGTDRNAVTVSHAVLAAAGDLGPVTVSSGSLIVGGANFPGLETAPAVTLDGASDARFMLRGSGSTPGANYSQLTSTGEVALGGARLLVEVSNIREGDPCPALGTVYTLVSTTGSLSGTFDVQADGLVPLAENCAGAVPLALRIDYHESGSPQTVTGTLVPFPPPGVAPGVAAGARVSGTVLLRRHGQEKFRVLKRTELIPQGSELDTTHGRVRLFAATNRHGGTTNAELYGGRFAFRQTGKARLRTRFALSQPLDGCGRARGSTATASRHRHRRRHVWVTEDGGDFDTRGQFVGTSVQGTTWLTADTCTTSFVRVKRGTVTVRDLVRHRTVTLHAGQSYTARKPR
jgi:hypothetical protein